MLFQATGDNGQRRLRPCWDSRKPRARGGNFLPIVERQLRCAFPHSHSFSSFHPCPSIIASCPTDCKKKLNDCSWIVDVTMPNAVSAHFATHFAMFRSFRMMPRPLSHGRGGVSTGKPLSLRALRALRADFSNHWNPVFLPLSSHFPPAGAAGSRTSGRGRFVFGWGEPPSLPHFLPLFNVREPVFTFFNVSSSAGSPPVSRW